MEHKLTRFIFVRHGETDFNLLHKRDVVDESRLTTLGHEQANNLITLLCDQSVSCVFRSPKTRCIQTLEPFSQKYPHIPVFSDSRLMEVDWGNLLSPLDGVLQDSEPMGDVGESPNALAERVLDFTRSILESYSGQTIVVVTHRDVIRTFFYLGIQKDSLKMKEGWFQMLATDKNFMPKNGEPYIFDI